MTSPLQENVLKLAEAREPVFSFLSSDPGGYSDEEMDEDLQELVRLAITLTLEEVVKCVKEPCDYCGDYCNERFLQNIKELMN